jgi:hypothetical protein
LTLDRGTKPPADIQLHPGKIGVVRYGSFDQIVWDGIKGRHDRLPISRISQNRW